MLAETLRRNRLKAGVLAVFGVGIMVVACESRLPQEGDPQATAVLTDEAHTRMKNEGTPAPFPTVSELMARHYPPLLREAGVGGTVMVQARIYASGKVERVGVVKSSGNLALDAAAVKVLNDMALFPSRTTTGTPQNEIANFSLTFDPQAKTAKLVPTQRRPEQPLREAEVAQVSGRDIPTPYTKLPALANRDEISRALVRAYPPLLRDAGIGGTTLIWIQVDETGNVTGRDIKTSSGRPELDDAALDVAARMKFAPAQNGSTPVKVWIALPIAFKTQ